MCSHLATVQDYQVGAIHHHLKGGQWSGQPELNKWKRCNGARGRLLSEKFVLFASETPGFCAGKIK